MSKAFFIIAALSLLNAAAAIEWSSESEETVHPGVNITKGDFLTKSVDLLVASRGDEITVNIRAWNEGEKRAILNITDELPEGTILASGDLSQDVVLEKNRSIDYSYTLRLIRGGQIELPATRAIIKYSNYTAEVSSGCLTILAIEPSQDMATPTSGKTPKKADGFEAVLVVVNFLIIFFMSSELCTVFKIRK